MEGRQVRRTVQFLQTDPIGYDDGPTIYAYVKGDPINRSDPTGLNAPPTPVGEVVVTAPRPVTGPIADALAGLGNSSMLNRLPGEIEPHIVLSANEQYDIAKALCDAGVLSSDNAACSKKSCDATTIVPTNGGSEVAVPAQAPGTRVQFFFGDVDVAIGVGRGYTVGRFYYDAVDGYSYEGYFISQETNGGADMSLDGGYGFSDNLGSFFGSSTCYNISMGGVGLEYCHSASGSGGAVSTGPGAGLSIQFNNTQMIGTLIRGGRSGSSDCPRK